MPTVKEGFRPRVGQVFMNKQRYWKRAEQLRSDHGGRLPDYVFDFISVHAPPDIIGANLKGYSLVSPMWLVEKFGRRPEFEDKRFEHLTDTVRIARELAIMHSIPERPIFVVYCK